MKNHKTLSKELNDEKVESFKRSAAHVEEVLSKTTSDYVACAVDPRSAKPALRPSASALYAGMHQVEPVVSRFTLTTSSANGNGYLVVDPFNCSACSDRAIAVSSLTGLATTTSSQLNLTASAGFIAPAYPGQASFTGAGLGANNSTGTFMSSYVSAAAVYIKPIGSAVTQNGRIFLLEPAGHPQGSPTAKAMTFGDLQSNPRTRVITGSQVSDPSFQNVLNYHSQPIPSALAYYNEYNAPSAATDSVVHQALVVGFSGDVSTTYSIEIHAVYGCRGSWTQPTTPRFVDFDGMQAFLNLVTMKRMSGWVGHPGVILQAYRAMMAYHSKMLEPSAKVKLEKARAELDKSKANRPNSSWFWSGLKQIAPIAAELAGLYLK